MTMQAMLEGAWTELHQICNNQNSRSPFVRNWERNALRCLKSLHQFWEQLKARICEFTAYANSY